MKKNRLWNIVLVLSFVLMLAGETLAVLAIIRLDMLPDVYLLAVIGLFAVWSLSVGLMLFVKGKKSGKGRRIAACVLALLMVFGCVAITTVATDVMKTLEATSQEVEEVATREVYILKDNPVENIADTVGYTYGYVKNYDEGCTQQALDEIFLRTDGLVSTAGYTDMFTMVHALLDNRIDAMILNGGFVSILEDTEELMDFSDRTKILAQIEVDETKEMEGNVTDPIYMEQTPEETTDTTEPAEALPLDTPVDYSSLKPFIVYVSGSDSYNTKIVKNGRSDVNILAVINPMTKQVLLINTPRDYYVQNTAGGGARDKLTHCGIYGTSCSMKTLGILYDASFEYFVRINFTGFKKLIDALGGITVYSDYAFTAITRTPIQKGENHLDGQQALDFARERYTLKGGDNERGKHQMQVITAVIEKATTGTTIISNYSDIMASVEGMFSMNVPTELISNLMKMQLSDMARWNVISYSATGKGSSEVCYSAPGMKLSVIKPSQSSVSKASRLIDMVYAGEILTEEVINSIS